MGFFPPGIAGSATEKSLCDSVYTSREMAYLESILRGQDLSQAHQRLVLETVLSIQESTYFHKSKRFPALLEYIVSHSIDGICSKLKERTIGIELFDRPESYDASSDPVVRVAIAEVRKRLALYYSEHLDAQVRIDLPVGHYEPEFRVRAHREDDVLAEQSRRKWEDRVTNETAASPDVVVPVAGHEIFDRRDQPFEDFEHRDDPRSELPVGLDMADADQSKRRMERQERPSRSQLHRRIYIAAPILLVVLLIAIWSANLLSSASPINKFWVPLLNSPDQVLIAVAVPSFEDPRNSPDSMGRFLTKQQNYPVPDMGAADSIKTFLSSRHRQSIISLAPSTTLSELHRAPAVVLGSSRMNPWVMLLGAGLHFQFEDDKEARVHWIQDTNNSTNRSWAVDLSIPYNQVTNEFALITRGYNSTTGQWWIGIGSTTGLGTIGAAQMLMDPNAMKALNAQLPKDWDRKNLQIVIEFRVVNGSLGASHVVATYLW